MALTNDGASEFSEGADIHVVSSSSPGGSGSSGGSTGFKTFLRQKFNPKVSTIDAFITIYEAVMRQATSEKKGTKC